jgi:hypothetical protein
MLRSLAIVTMLCCCGGDGSSAHDAGLDAPRRLAITVDGPAEVAATRTVKVSITSNGSTRNDTFPVGGLPATVDVPQPIQLSDWVITVTGYDMSSTLLGLGMTTVPALTSETTVTLQPQ